MVSKSILFIVTSLQEGGAGKMVHHISGVLAREYNNVYAVAVNKEQLLTRVNGVHYLEPLGKHNGGLLGFASTIISIRKLVKNIRPDIVITFVSDVAVCTRLATLFMRNIIVVSAERGDPFTQGKKWELLTKWAYSHSDWCFFQLSKARDFYGPKVIEKSYVIPNAAFFNGRVRCHQSKNKTIVSAGRFVWEKGYDLLIDVFKLVHDKHPEYSLILYGDGDLKSEYEIQIENLGLTGFVSFPGYTNNVEAALCNEDIFVLPSRFEGIPNVLIEALLIGIPTVSCDCNPGGPRFLTDNGKRGIIVPVDNVEELAKGILKLIENRKLYKQYEQEGPSIVDELSPSIIEERWKNAFRMILNNNIDN